MNAARYACGMAHTLQASVELMNVQPLPVTISEVPMPVDTLAIAIEESERELKELKATLQNETNDKITITVSATTGNLMSELGDLTASTKPLAVVMGMQGSGGGERWLFGSNAEAAMRQLPCPVIIVPHDAVYKKTERLGLACDMKDVAGTIPFNSIRNIIALLQCELHILNIHPGERENKEEVEAILLKNKLSDLDPDIHFIGREDTTKAILELVDLSHIDMLVVVPKKHGLIGSMFHKSFSNHVAEHMHIPVMALHL